MSSRRTRRRSGPGPGRARRRGGRRLLIALAAGLLLEACTTAPTTVVTTPGPGVEAVHVTADAAIHGIVSTIDVLYVDYGREVQLPDGDPEDLYSLTDSGSEAGGPHRGVAAVYTNDAREVRRGAEPVRGRYVVVELEPVAAPEPDRGGTWRPEGQAGTAVSHRGWVNQRRTDYSGLELRQGVDLLDDTGSLVRRAGVLPELDQRDVQWPELAAFTVDAVLRGTDADIRYSYALPDGYDPSRRYPLVVLVPGYGDLLHSDDAATRGVNVYSSTSVVAWTRTGEPTIVVAAQPVGYGASAAAEVVELTEHVLRSFAVDEERVYAVGYSAGGEIMSQVLNTRADLFTAYVHASSQWDGTVDDVVAHRTAVYLFMGRTDEWYGPERATEAFAALTAGYDAAGLGPEEIGGLVALDLADDDWFHERGVRYVHAGGQLVADRDGVVPWLLGRRRP